MRIILEHSEEMDVIFFQLFYCCRSWKKSYNLQNERSSLWFLYVRIMNYNLVDLKSEIWETRSFTCEVKILCSRLRKNKKKQDYFEIRKSTELLLQMTSSWENVSIFFLWWMIVFLYRFRFETDSSLYKD